jgi:hypothetical protein
MFNWLNPGRRWCDSVGDDFGGLAMRCWLVFLSLCFASVASAQIEVKSESATALSGLENPTVVGDLILFDKGTPQLKPVGVVYVEAVGSVSVDATNEKRMPVEIKQVSPGVYLVESPGKTWVEVSEYGEVELAGGARRKILLDRKTVVVEVGPVPTPPDPPGPGPGPGPTPSPFSDLTARVSQLAQSLPVANRLKLQQVFDEAAMKLARGEFLQVRQASDYITANRPQCTPGSGCAELYNFLAADARGRTLSVTAVQEYYRAIAKGFRQ